MTNPPNHNNRTALIVGATGLIGQYCLQALLRDGAYTKVTALVRREMDIQHDKLQQQVVDFDDLKAYKDIIKADDIFCCLGTTMKKAGSKDQFLQVDFHYPMEVARIALENGAQQYLIVTALGADPDSRIFYNKAKGQVEGALAALNYPALQIFQPSMLLGSRDERRVLEAIGQSLFKALSFLFVGPLKKYKGIRGQVVGEVMVHQAKQQVTGKKVLPSDEIQAIYDKALAA